MWNLGLWLTRDGITYMGQNKYALEETFILCKCQKSRGSGLECPAQTNP